MKRVVLLPCVLMALVLGSGAVRGGDLNPPPGAVAPTMVTLDSIEPRNILKTFFESGEAVNTITQPGQYVATGDIIVPAGKSGIVIDLPPGVAGAVTIDLNGFEIQGQPGSLDGVRKAGAFSACNFNLYNGRIVGMGGDGVHIENINEAHICVSIVGGGGDGMEFLNVPVVSAVAINSKAPPPGAGNIVKGMGGHCVRASGCGEVLIDYTLAECGLDGMHIENCTEALVAGTVRDCGGDGIELVSVPTVSSVAIKVKGTGAENNRVVGCGGNGVVATDCDDVNLSSFSVSQCTGDGLHIERAARVSLTNLRVDDCDDDGVDIRGGATAARTLIELVVVMALCDIRSTVNDGIHIEDAAHVSLTNVSAIRCGDNGLDMKQNDLAGRTQIELVVVIAVLAILASVDDGVHIEDASQVSMREVSIRDCGGDGVELHQNVLAGRATTELIVVMATIAILASSNHGLHIEGASSISLQDVECSRNAGSGIAIADFERDGRLDLVTCSSNGLHGIEVISSTGVPNGRIRATGIFADGNSANGVFFESTSGGEVAGCTASNNGGAGMMIFGSGHTVRSNSCSNNGGPPLLVTIPGNTLGPLVDETTVNSNCNPAANYVR